MLVTSESADSKFAGSIGLYLACFVLHFFFVVSASSQSILSIMAQGYTSLPHSVEQCWRRLEIVVSGALGQRLPSSNPLRRLVSTYLSIAGIEKGYILFAPAVPNSYKVVFELHYGDGRVGYELPRVSGHAAGLRVATLLDHIGRTDYDQLREVILKMLAYSVWQEHPDAVTIRAVFGSIREPTATEASQGKGESYQFLSAYDFSFAPQQGNLETY